MEVETTRHSSILPSATVLPERYRLITDDECIERIHAHKRALGRRAVILGHHYQRPEIVRLSDIVGDSLELSRRAAESQAETIVFCGVRFMAESAAVLAKPGQTVVHPNPTAGCPLADSASCRDVAEAFEAFSKAGATPVIPLAYMNSSADVKAFVGEHGGAVCTSSNAPPAFRWALSIGRVMFVPDEHLGRNTAAAVGLPDGDIALWDPSEPAGGVEPGRFRSARVLLWKGDCHVHSYFRLDHVEKARAKYDRCRIVVHPECRREVVEAVDGAGSTSYLVAEAKRADAGGTLVIGTEINLVSRAASERPDVRILPLARSICPNMYKISPRYLLWTLDELGERHVVRVDDYVASGARAALERMMEIR